jgi:hypothetical protein
LATAYNASQRNVQRLIDDDDRRTFYQAKQAIIHLPFLVKKILHELNQENEKKMNLKNALGFR